MMDVKAFVRCLFIAGLILAYIVWTVYEIRSPFKLDSAAFCMWLIITAAVIYSAAIWAWS